MNKYTEIFIKKKILKIKTDETENLFKEKKTTKIK